MTHTHNNSAALAMGELQSQFEAFSESFQRRSIEADPYGQSSVSNYLDGQHVAFSMAAEFLRNAIARLSDDLNRDASNGLHQSDIRIQSKTICNDCYLRHNCPLVHQREPIINVTMVRDGTITAEVACHVKEGGDE